MRPEAIPFDATAQLSVAGQEYTHIDLRALDDEGICELSTLPYSIRVLLESVLRNADGEQVTEAHVHRAASWKSDVPDAAIPFLPSRVIMQDLTGVPAVVDLAAMRSALERADQDPTKINFDIPADLVIDHSVQVDQYGHETAFERNVDLEYQRNEERYRALKWGADAFSELDVVPPGTGIVHQVNLEYLGTVVDTRIIDGDEWLVPDTVLGTDSHTPMIGGIGVLGWGVGGIEAEAALLGQPISMPLPDVLGVRLEGTLPTGATATDLVLHLTQWLRSIGVVDQFVEFFGPSIDQLSVEDRATIANMAPEQGSTVSLFPPDEATLDYLRRTGRSDDQIKRIEAYLEATGLVPDTVPDYSAIRSFDLSTVEPSVAGPSQPEERVGLSDVKSTAREVMPVARPDDSHTTAPDDIESHKGQMTQVRPSESGVPITMPDGRQTVIDHGSVVVSAITSCTNTSNPSVLLAAGLLAQNAVDRGLEVPAHVKTSLAPGSRVVSEYLDEAGLMDPLERLGYHVVGYGCTTCIGNAGPLPAPVEVAIDDHDLWTASVLSGNRNFEARIHPKIRGNYLMSPPLVVAFGLAGRIDLDFETEPIGTDADGQDVYLRDIWPDQDVIDEAIDRAIDPDTFEEQYANVYAGDQRWERLETPTGATYDWDESSTYIREPPFFEDLPRTAPGIDSIEDARCLLVLGDSVTTDHISPAGPFGPDVPAGEWLRDHEVPIEAFNTYGARRGNHEVMIRGTFANVRIRNQLFEDREGGITIYHPTDEVTTVYDAAQRYQAADTPLVVLAGEAFGTGSSRDWAAKGTALLGVEATIAQSYERIYRDNLIAMGVLPLRFDAGESWKSLGLDGTEQYSIDLDRPIEPEGSATVVATDGRGTETEFATTLAVPTQDGIRSLEHDGILNRILRRTLSE